VSTTVPLPTIVTGSVVPLSTPIGGVGPRLQAALATISDRRRERSRGSAFRHSTPDPMGVIVRSRRAACFAHSERSRVEAPPDVDLLAGRSL
jgi:hypothetical protein